MGGCPRLKFALECLQAGLQSGEPFALDLKLFPRNQFEFLEGLREERLQVALEIGGRAGPKQVSDPHLRVGKQLLRGRDHRQFLVGGSGPCCRVDQSVPGEKRRAQKRVASLARAWRAPAPQAGAGTRSRDRPRPVLGRLVSGKPIRQAAMVRIGWHGICETSPPNPFLT